MSFSPETLTLAKKYTNKAIKEIEGIDYHPAPTKLSELTNDAGFITANDLPEVDVPSPILQGLTEPSSDLGDEGNFYYHLTEDNGAYYIVDIYRKTSEEWQKL